MKKLLTIAGLAAMLLILDNPTAMAQGNPPPPPTNGGNSGGPPPPPPPIGVPLDGGLSALLAAGAALGAKKFRKEQA
jgi:hypothetical protein